MTFHFSFAAVDSIGLTARFSIQLSNYRYYFRMWSVQPPPSKKFHLVRQYRQLNQEIHPLNTSFNFWTFFCRFFFLLNRAYEAQITGELSELLSCIDQIFMFIAGLLSPCPLLCFYVLFFFYFFLCGDHVVEKADCHWPNSNNREQPTANSF